MTVPSLDPKKPSLVKATKIRNESGIGNGDSMGICLKHIIWV